MFKAFTLAGTRKWSFTLLGLCLILAVAAALVGIDDNPPGLILAFLSSCSLVTAFVLHWRSTKSFLFLSLSAVAAFVVFVLLENVLEYGANTLENTGFWGTFLGIAGAIFMMLAIFLAVSAFLIGIVGLLVMAMRESRGKPGSPKT